MVVGHKRRLQKMQKQLQRQCNIAGEKMEALDQGCDGVQQREEKRFPTETSGLLDIEE